MDVRRVVIVACVLVAACVAAIVLARPEAIPASLAPPEHSNVVMNKPAETEAAESAEADPSDEPHAGYALSRQDLEQGLLKVRERARGCRDPSTPPVVPTKIVIAPNGSVTSVSIAPEVRATEAGECIVRALHGASFPAWSAPSVPQLEWSYPLRFDGE